MTRSHTFGNGHKPQRRAKGGRKPARRSPKACPRCASGNATHDATAWVSDHRLIDRSHCMVTAMHCRACGRRALDIWTELIDWDGGDDSTASLIVPFPANANEAFLHHETSEKLIHDTLRRWGPCPYLATTHPRGESASPWTWCNDQPFILPHD